MPISQSSVTSLVLWSKFSDVKPTKYGPYLVTVSFVNFDGEIDTFSGIMIYDPFTGSWYDDARDVGDDYRYEDGEVLYWAKMPIAPVQ